MNSNPLRIYAHYPFCTKKCPYCHFFVLKHKPQKDSFLNLLLQEWALWKPWVDNRPISSLYLGGGTPSLETDWKRFINAFPLEKNAEITLEVNPETVSVDRLKQWKDAGINRLSFGLQSLDESLLKKLGRSHSALESIRAVEAADKIGFNSLSIDLMYEVPFQTLSIWENTLTKALNLPIDHLSLYNLTFEPGTVFTRKKKALSPHLPSDIEAAEMLAIAESMCKKGGFFRYEISAFAKPNHQAKHNTGYWKSEEWLGLGPSAYSYYQGSRFRNVPNVQKYRDALRQEAFPIDYSEKLSQEKSKREKIAIALRLFEGINLKSYSSLPPLLLRDIDALVNKGLLEQEGPILRLSKLGRNFYEDVGIALI